MQPAVNTIVQADFITES